MAVERKDFGQLSDGSRVSLYTITNARGESVSLTDYGASVVSLLVHDRQGALRDIVLGCDDAPAYERQTACLGGVPGRHANRIARGRFVLNGKTYQLAINNGENHLHGGPTGFHRRLWRAAVGENSLTFTRLSCDGEEGYPGNLLVSVRYTFDDECRLGIHYQALCDQDTVINLTNHSYFNLDGDAGSNAEHLLMIDADYYTPVDSTFMTSGEIVPVEDTPMDFRSPVAVGTRINNFDFVQLKNGNGYDHNWVLNTKGDITCKCATLQSSKTGIILDVYTNEPGIQVYAGNFLDGTVKGKKGIVYNQRASVCLETQKYPDTPNKPEWPSAVLRPGEKYHSHCIFKFSVDK